MRYLINCSGSKKKPDTISSGKLSELSFNQELYDYRCTIIANAGIELDWDRTLPAWEIYTGLVYKQISENNWLKKSTNILILSALFGWIKHTDKIPYYDLSMNNHKINNKPVYKTWLDYNILIHLIDKERDIDLLTQPYRKAIHNKKTPVALTPYEKFKDNYGTHKGKWLNSELDKQ